MSLSTPQYILLVHLCRFAVRVPAGLCLADFLGSMITGAIAAYCQVRLFRRICLPESAPTPFNGDFRRPAAVSLLRLHVAPAGSNGMLTVSAIGLAARLSLRARLTPG